MTLEDKVHTFRLHALHRAEVLGNVTATCRELGISRTVFYRWRSRLKQYGVDGLHPTRRSASRGRPPALSLQDKQSILALAVGYPARGPLFYAYLLAQQSRHLSPSTIYRALKRAGLGTRVERMALLERHSARRAGLLTERTRRQLQKARRLGRHVHSKHPGDLVCLDTFYIGKLKGVGKVWQITACDTASSFAVAKILPANNASNAARFLRDLATSYNQAGWPIQRVLTDRGSEFKADFDQACDELNLKHTRTKPRHAWTNGFVERLQGTILHEHWRIAFRRRFFTTRQQLEQSLQRFLIYYNDERPHFGYRTKGRRPSDIFWGAKGRT